MFTGVSCKPFIWHFIRLPFRESQFAASYKTIITTDWKLIFAGKAGAKIGGGAAAARGASELP